MRCRRAPAGRAARLTAALVVGVALACSGDAGAGPGPAPGEPAPAEGAGEDWVARSDSDAVFTVDCAFSHRAPDDPIVHPGRPGASHSHDFFGSTATDASSTGEALRGTETTCEDRRDTAAYWVPTLSVDGRVVDPAGLRAYYRAPVGADVREVVAPPLGLAMIAGDAALGAHGHDAGDHGTTDDHHVQDHDHDHDDHHVHEDSGHGDHGSAPGGAATGDDPPPAGWGCGLRPLRLRGAPPDDCTALSPLTLHLRFPDCWDGESLDSPDHRAHVARSEGGRCPPDHPVLLTEVQLSIWWPVTGAEGGRATLDSGGHAGAHGDFLNGWDPEALAHHVELCIHAKANCTIG